MNVRLTAGALLLIVGNALLPQVVAAAPIQVSHGITVGTSLPREAAKVRVGREIYFVYHGSFYQPVAQGFVLVPAPQSAQVSQLPRGAVQFTHGQTDYFCHAGVWYRALRRGFEVCAAPGPVGPTASEPVSVRLAGEQFVFKDGVFFRETADGLLARGAPIGAVTNEFPPDAVSVWFEGSEYFESRGVFFQEVGGGFEVVQAPWTALLLAGR